METDLVLPKIREDMVWDIRPHRGNAEDGVYLDGEAYLVGIRQPHKFLWWTFLPLVMGVEARIVLNSSGVKGMQKAVDKVYESYQRKISEDKIK